MIPQDGWTLNTVNLKGTFWRFVIQFYGDLTGTPALGTDVDALSSEQIAEAYHAVGAFYVSVSGTREELPVNNNIVSRNSVFVIGQSVTPSYIPPVPGGPINSITITGLSSTTMNVGNLVQLVATIYYANGAVATHDKGTWTSNAANIADVDENGHLEANAVGGPVTITYTAPDGVTTSQLQVNVAA